MQLRIGTFGIGLVLAFVVGGIAQQPFSGPIADSIPPNSISELPETGGPSAGPVDRLPAAQNPLSATDLVPQVGSAGELIGFNGFDGSGSQTITLVHTGKMQIAVYHIDRSGRIHLVSSRPIDADFSLSLNVNDPLPSQIRLLGGDPK